MFAVKLCLPCPFCISNLTVTVKAHNMSFLMETLCQTSLMGNYISLSFVSPAIQGAWNIKSTWIYQIGRVCFTLLGDGTAYVIYLGAVSGKSSIPLGQKINNTIDGSGKYAILPDLGYNNHAISVNLINIFFPWKCEAKFNHISFFQNAKLFYDICNHIKMLLPTML